MTFKDITGATAVFRSANPTTGLALIYMDPSLPTTLRRLTGPIALALVALGLAALPPAALANPITDENALPGDSAWTGWRSEADTTAIDGYTSTVSVATGDTLALHVASSARYRVEIDRLGWYGGLGGRRVACLPACDGDRAPVPQPAPPAPDGFGRVDAHWSVTDTVQVPASWTTGYYLARFVLTSGADAGKERFYPFVVRESGRAADILVQVPVTTWQAYDNWGGKSLYASGSTGGAPAVKVSFNRPLSDNQSPVFGREYQAVRYLEQMGYDVAYTTDVDVAQNPDQLYAHPVIVSVGHDEYWTHEMRAAWDAARASDHNLIFLGADAATWQVRLEDGGRTLVGYKGRSDPEPTGAFKTMMFRNLVPPNPECRLEGVQFDGNSPHPGKRGYTVTAAAAANPWIQASGLHPGDVLPGAVAYEWDRIVPGCLSPAVTALFHYEPPSGSDESPADAVALTDPSGGRVFSSGSNQFSIQLDDYNAQAGQAQDQRVRDFLAAMLDDMVRTGSRLPPAAPAPTPQPTPAPAPDSRLRISHTRLHLKRNRLLRIRMRASGVDRITGRLTATAVRRGHRKRIPLFRRLRFSVLPDHTLLLRLRLSRPLVRRLPNGRYALTLRATYKVRSGRTRVAVAHVRLTVRR